jgi:hypothetical protein
MNATTCSPSKASERETRVKNLASYNKSIKQVECREDAKRTLDLKEEDRKKLELIARRGLY